MNTTPNRCAARPGLRWIARRLGALALIPTLVAAMTTGLSLTVAPSAAAAAALRCDQNTVYGLGSDNQLTAINVNTGATTIVSSMAPTNNALGLTSNGVDAWGWQSNSGTSTIAHYDTVTGTTQTISGVDPAAPSTMIRGAINPATGIYYYGSSGGDAYLGAYDTGSVSGTPRAIGKVGTISGLLSSANGDFAFSSQGLLFVVTGNQIRRVDDTTPPTTAGNELLTTTLVASLDSSVNSPGITFASSGYLYVVSGSSLIKLDPANGSILATVPISGGYTASDLGSCTYPNTIVAQKNVVARAFPTDEFTLTVTGGNIIANNVATTTGTATGLQAATAGAVLVLPGSTYTVAETAAGTTVLSDYTSSYRCVNNTTGVDALPAGGGTTASFLFPAPTTPAGVDVDCVFTNVAKPAVTVTAALAGARAANTDQFTTAIRTGSATGPVVNVSTNATTTGTGSTVTTGTGTTGRYVGAAGTTYYVTENAAGTTTLARYARTISCTDSNGLQTGLPSNAAFAGSLALTVVDGAQISCTVTAAPAGASLTVVAALGSPRAADADQFTPAIRTGSAVGPVVNNTTASTTTGTGSTVTAGTGTTGGFSATVGTPYYLTESIAGPGAALYDRTIACVDTNGLQTGLPSGAFTNPSITPVSGANIVCTITASGTPAALSLVKANPAQLIAGTAGAYTLTATNSGGTAATTARILDRLPANVQYTSAAGAGWSCTTSGTVSPGQLVDCAYAGSIAPLGGTSTLTMTVTPRAGAAGTSTQNRAAIGVTPGATPVDPGSCTATGNPTGCAVPSSVSVRLVTARDDTASTMPGTAVSTAVLVGDTVTPDGALNPASVTVTTPPAHGGTAVDPTTGAVTYTPVNGFSGLDSYRYQVCDRSTPTPVCASAEVAVSVPNTVTAGPESASTAQNTAVDVAVLANDTVSPNGAPLDPGSVSVPTGPTHGTTVVDPTTGVVTYTPGSGYSGTDSFGYRVCDRSIPAPVCATATVNVTVGVNTVSAGPDSAQTPPVTAVGIDVLANDTSGTGQPLANPTVTGGPGHGTTSVAAATGLVTYTPANGFSGVDTFTYRVCDTSNPTPVCASALVTVTVPNDVVAHDDTATTPQNTAVTTAVLTDDTVSPGGAALNPGSVTVPRGPAHGAVAVLPSGAITYTPAAGYSGSDDYRYAVCDTSVPTPTCASALVVILVDANVVIAADENGTTPPLTPVTVPVLDDATSSTGQPLTAPTVADAPAHGTAVVNSAGAIVYTPADGFSGVDSFPYTLCDTSIPIPVCDTATITITVPTDLVVADDSSATGQNVAVTTAVLANDSVPAGAAPLDPASVTVGTPPAHGSTTVNRETGAVTYTPEQDFSGTDSYTYTVCDGSVPVPVCGSATVVVTVGANTLSVVDDTATAVQGGPVVIDVLGNDAVSPGGAPLDPGSVSVPAAPAHGSVTVDPANGVITYTPEAGFSGPDSFTYQVCDTSAPTPVCGTATVSVTVLRTGLSFVKSASVSDTNGDGVVSVGDTIDYSFAIGNVGEVPVSGIVVEDPTAGETTCPQGTLAPGETMECVAVTGHVITDADAAAGGVTNSAHVRGAGVCPDGTGCPVPTEVLSDVGTVVTPIPGGAQLAVTKTGSWTDSDGSGSASVGDLVAWSISVTNPGTVAVEALSVSDPTAGTVVCVDDTVAPGATIGCAVPGRTLTAADVAQGSVSNTALATGIGPAGAVVSPAVTALVTLPHQGALPYTGFATADALWAALLLAAAGAVLMVVGRRRSRG